MNILLSSALATILGGLKIFIPTIASTVGVPKEDQDAVTTLADNLIAYIQKPEPLDQEFLDNCNALVMILKNIKAGSNAEISRAFAFVIGGLEGLKIEILSSVPPTASVTPM